MRPVNPELSIRKEKRIGPYKPLDIEIGQYLRALRKARGWSQRTLGNQIGVTFQQIQKYENGANSLTATRLYELAAIFDVSIESFFPDHRQKNLTTESTSYPVVPFALARSYLRIKQPAIRRALVNLAKSIAQDT